MMPTKAVVSQVLVMLVFVCACKKNDFTDAHITELQKDCNETLRCTSGALQSASSDLLDDCVHSAGDRLDSAGEAAQQEFLDTVGRCQLQQICDYVSCTQANPMTGFAAANQALINYDCQQIVACRISMNEAQTMTAVTDCSTQQANTLNAATPQIQMTYAARGMKCSGQASCAWVNCM
jgi:hypothetical protein